MDRSKGNKRNWILVWEDGFCDFSACSAAREAKSGARCGSNYYPSEDSAEPTMHPELFFKMSHEVCNYGEGLMGKVAYELFLEHGVDSAHMESGINEGI
ncbi:hypothetical protein R1flu_016300 [Riccia fluitans]|uniref:Uncharacterized protein n=1 Tax=Riccia fluitans TaxID=41844 RepID=A0ABD1YPL8_9MARC